MEVSEQKLVSDLTMLLRARALQGEPARITAWKIGADDRSVVAKAVSNGRLLDVEFNEQGISYSASSERSDAFWDGYLLAATGIGLRPVERRLFRLDSGKKNCSSSTSQPCGRTCISNQDRCGVSDPKTAQMSQRIISYALQVRQPEGMPSAASIPGGRPGSVLPSNSKSSPVSPIAAKAVLKAENEIRLRPVENGVAIDPRTGETLFEKSGTHNSISFTEDETKRMRGAIFTHNHPTAITVLDADPDSEIARGASFSPDDLQMACYNNFAEMRAVCIGYRHVMGPPSGGFTKDLYDSKIVPSLTRNIEIVNREVGREIAAGRLSAMDAHAVSWHKIWERVAKDTGMKYSREAIPGNHAKDIEEMRAPERKRRRQEDLKRTAAVAGILVLLSLANSATEEAAQAEREPLGGRDRPPK